MMRTDNLDQKVRVFADREVESLVNHADFHFGDLMRLPLETKDGLVLESTFCDGYHDLKYLLAMSVQAGCASKCRFCELGDGGLERDLTTDEILDQLALLLKTAMKRGYHIFDRPLKASFVMGGEPLDNQQFSGVLRKMKDDVPLQVKVSTIFPASEKSLSIYGDILEVAKEYPNIVQFQISLNSTDPEYRQGLVAVPLADYQTINSAAERWAEEVPNPRMIDLTFTVNEETPMDPYKIKDVLSPELFAIRLRDCKPTPVGKRNRLGFVGRKYVWDLSRQFEDCGYTVIPGLSGETEQKFRLSAGESIKFYRMMRTGHPCQQASR